MSVSEVAQRLKFSMRHIEALEADRYDALPGGPYARGMVRTYAKLLGIDAAPLLDALPRPADAGEAPMQPRDMSVPFPQDAHSGSRLYLLLSMLIIVAVVVVLAEWFLRSQRDVAAPEPAIESAAKAETPPAPAFAAAADSAATPAPSEAQGAQPPADAGAPPAVATEPAPPASSTQTTETMSSTNLNATTPPGQSAAAAPLAPGKSRLTFNFELESWVEVTDGKGAVILSAINPAGSEKVVVGTPPLSLVIGNASGVRLTFNGEPVTLKPHRSSDVARLTLE